jgi:hypothetical protein
MPERQRRDRGESRILLALALVLPILACSSGSDQSANPMKSSEVGEDGSSAAPGCNATALDQLTTACNDEESRPRR